MTKNITLLITILLSFNLSAQQEKESVIGINVGGSFTGATYRLALKIVEDDSIASTLVGGSNTPVMALSFDYGVNEQFSIGALASIQHFSADINEVDINFLDTIVISGITTNFNRFYIGVVPRYQYTTNNDRLELYSAARVGFIFWFTDFDSENSRIDALKGFGGGRPAFSLVAIGGRYYFDNHFGVNFELATGAPFLASIGLNYKL
jgi:hypothetical protein